MDAFHPDLPTLLDERMRGHVETGETGGIAWLAARGDEVVAGALTRGSAAPVGRDSLFRIASITKPIVSVAALVLVEECRLRLGMDFTAPWPQPLLDAMGELGLAPGAPEPGVPPAPDEWIRRLGTLPLLCQPGERWLYNTATDILGVLVGRAAGMPFDRFLHERVLEPLGMSDTGFSTTAVDRLGSSYSVGDDGARSVYDAPDGAWATPPAFPSGAAGLVSTLDDLAAFGRMLLAGGHLADGSRLLGRASVEAMTTDQLDLAVGRDAGITPDGSMGWGFGVGVQLRRTGPVRTVGSYGWDGGLGSSWANDPAERLVAVVLSTDMFTGPARLPRPLADFWTTVYASLGD